jgi:hypothetical protein
VGVGVGGQRHLRQHAARQHHPRRHAGAGAELSGIWALALGRNGPSGFAADTQGRVFHWGNNYSGQAGDGTSSGNGAVRKVPALVPGLSNVAALAAADTSFVAAQWGAGLSGWGHNEAGALGTTARTQRGGLPLPVQPIPA